MDDGQRLGQQRGIRCMVQAIPPKNGALCRIRAEQLPRNESGQPCQRTKWTDSEGCAQDDRADTCGVLRRNGQGDRTRKRLRHENGVLLRKPCGHRINVILQTHLVFVADHHGRQTCTDSGQQGREQFSGSIEAGQEKRSWCFGRAHGAYARNGASSFIAASCHHANGMTTARGCRLPSLACGSAVTSRDSVNRTCALRVQHGTHSLLLNGRGGGWRQVATGFPERA